MTRDLSVRFVSWPPRQLKKFYLTILGVFYVWSQGCTKTSELGHMVLSKDRAIKAPDFLM